MRWMILALLPSIAWAQTAPTSSDLYEGHLACAKVLILEGNGPISHRIKTYPPEHKEACEKIEAAYQAYLDEVNKAADLQRAHNLANRIGPK